MDGRLSEVGLFVFYKKILLRFYFFLKKIIEKNKSQ
jgi:hypothetical protein